MPKNNQLYALAVFIISIILCVSCNTNIRAEESLGMVYKDQGKYDEAIRWFKEAIKADPNSTGSYIGLGWILHNYEGNDDEAIRCFKEAIRINPNASSGYAGLAWVYKDQGKYDEAIKWFKEAIRINPKDSASHSGLDWVYSEQKNYRAAIRGRTNAKK